jgi:hypothetical protein
MIVAILATDSNDTEFISNELNGVDLLMDAVDKSVQKMASAKIYRLYEAKERKMKNGRKRRSNCRNDQKRDYKPRIQYRK